MMDEQFSNMHLCFVYVPKFKGINDIEVIVDPHYTCHYDKSTKHLSIEKNPRIPDGFWGERIHSVAAIVGNNGVGKSTVVEFILQGIVEGADSRGIDGVFVYEKNGALYVYSKERIDLPSDVIRLEEPESICCLYYSGHFIPDSANNLRCRELAGSYNISDGFLLLKDVQNYANIDYYNRRFSFYDHLDIYKAINHIRICRFISDQKYSDLLDGYLHLKYVLVRVNSSGRYALEDYKNRKAIVGESPKPPVPSLVSRHHNARENALSEHIYYNFLNILFDQGHSFIDKETFECLADWLNNLNNTESVLDQFDEFIKKRVTNSVLSYRLRVVYNALSKLDKLASFRVGLGTSGFFYFEVSSELKKIQELADYLEQPQYLVSQLFDMAYAQDLNTDTVLSSGEQGVLDLLSRLYYTINKDCSKFSNLNAPALLILDEAEHSFHPEWQREYLFLLFSFIQRLNLNMRFKFQILITTHSPLLLSDIPISCITFLKKGDDGKSRTVHPDMTETFAANVFDLYRNSFFVENGMIGAFAANKLTELEDRVRESKQLDDKQFNDLLREIDLVGDGRIRFYLHSGINRNQDDNELSYLRARIKELEKKHRNE